MDISSEFRNLVRSETSDEAAVDRKEFAFQNFAPPSPFVLTAGEMLTNILAFDQLVQSSVEDFIDYHRYLPSKRTSSRFLTEAEKDEFYREINSFVTAMGADVNDLRKSITSRNLEHQSKSSQSHHHHEIAIYILEKLSAFSKRAQKMQKERELMNINPFRLLSSSYDPGALYKQPQINQGVVVSADSGVESNSAPIQKSKNLRSVETAPKPLPSYFASRYEDEIASTSKISEYKSLGEKYKSILLKEANELQIRFSKDLQVANKMESTVNSISTMLTEFVEIIQGQREAVEDVREAAVDSTQYVKDTDEELLLTLERSQSHSRNMMILTVALAVLILFLDWITP